MVWDKLWYRKWCYIYIYYVRGDFGGCSCSSSKMTPTMSMPPDSCQILTICIDVVPYMPAWNGGGGPYMLVLGPTCWCWVLHTGVRLYMWVLACTRRCLAWNGGIEHYTLALGLRHRCWLYTLVFSSKCCCWIINHRTEHDLLTCGWQEKHCWCHDQVPKWGTTFFFFTYNLLDAGTCTGCHRHHFLIASGCSWESSRGGQGSSSRGSICIENQLLCVTTLNNSDFIVVIVNSRSCIWVFKGWS